MTPDLQRVSAIISEIAENEIAARYGRLDTSAVRSKDGPNDFVTVADEAAELALKLALLDITPGAAFIGEEAAAVNPAVAFDLKKEERCWIVDPLDGTRNFVKGVDEFGTIVAYVENGVTKAGWIYAIPLQAMAVVSRGDGFTWRGERISVKSQADARPRGLRSTGWLRPEWRDRLANNLKTNVHSQPGHCSAYAYVRLLLGEVDFMLSSRIHAWDHAAGALMLEEIGGAVRWLDSGACYGPQASEDRPLLATAAGRSWVDTAQRLTG